VLEQASESFKIQLIREEDNGDEVLSIDKIQADQSPIIKLVDSAVFDALNRAPPTSTSRRATARW
jgi:type IV pilus assembly protein PilB